MPKLRETELRTKSKEVREAFKKKNSRFWDIVRKWEGGSEKSQTFFQNLVWTFFNRGVGFCHHAQTVKS